MGNALNRFHFNTEAHFGDSGVVTRPKTGQRLFGLGFLLAFLAAVFSSSAATYYVSITGSDANAGTSMAPWRTLQKAANTMAAGDIAVVSPGNYGEYVMTRAHGNNSAPIVFRASPPNDPKNQVITRQFRVKHRNIVIEGFNLTGASDLNNAAVRIEYDGAATDGSRCVVTNNTIRDGVYQITRTAQFGTNYIRITDGNFNAAGFVAGSLVFFGSDSMYAYTNHDTRHTVASISADGKTLYVTDTLLPDAGSNYWAVVYAGQANTAFKGVYLVPGGGTSAANDCVIANNTFTNLFGPAVILNGDRHLVKGNQFRNCNGWYAMQLQGRSIVVRENLILNNRNIIFFTPDEMKSITHPAGGNYFDFQENIVASWCTDSTNILFERNWIQDCDNQLTMIEQATNSYGFVIRSNVFVGIHSHGSFSRSGLSFDHNTFYRNAFYLGEANALGIGGMRGWLQTNLVITGNAFVDNGSHEQTNNEGSFAYTDVSSPVVASNFCCSAETMGFRPVSPAPPGVLVNGGDPGFLNARDPLGPDGLPFTADDGIRPLPNSPLAIHGLGALPPVAITVGKPLPHFSLKSPQGWFDASGTNFDPAWSALKPHQRTQPIRLWNTPEALGQAPVSALFDASRSIDGLSSLSKTNTGIAAYAWDFGDGTRTVSGSPSVNHMFTSGGTFTVTLTVTNSVGGSASFSNSYRVLGQVVVSPPDPTNAPVVLGGVPAVLSLNASNWFGQLGSAATSAPISVYCWDFGDGAKVISYSPQVTHTFLSTGTNQVTLTITNSLGVSASAANSYITVSNLAGVKVWHVAKTGSDSTGDGTQAKPFATPGKAISVLSGGDYVAVHEGTYGAIADMNRNVATAQKRVTFIGYGAVLPGINLRYPYCTVDGFRFSGPAITYGAPIYLYSIAHGTWIVNNTIGPFTNKTYGIFISRGPSGDPTVSPGNCIISNNVFQAIDWIQICMYGQSNLVAGNVFRDGNDQADTFRIWGRGHRVVGNLMTNVSILRENHTDWYQIFGPDPALLGRAVTTNDYDWAKDIVFEANTVVNSQAQICMIETFSNPPGWFTNIVFRNNQFINVAYQGNIDGDGTKWYNNLFYRVNFVNAGHVFAFGGPKGSAYGTEIMNCAFVACGNGFNYGWYPIVGDSGATNWNLKADYNFVCGSNFVAMPVAPPDNGQRFRSQGQDPHSINGGDPGFLSLAANDFRLGPNSPLIGGGTNLSSMFRTDYSGFPRPTTGAWDIGPFIYSPNATPPPAVTPPSRLRVTLN
jgi:PKD repeat protein